MDINKLFALTKEKFASDLHLGVGEPPVLRINGKLEKMDLPILTVEEVKNIINSILTNNQKTRYEEDWELDFSLEAKNIARFRVNVYKQRKGDALAFRLIPAVIKSIEDLELPLQIKEFVNYQRGLILATGPTGSGKSTTLAAIMDLINKERHDHIITIEDPIEFIHENKNCIINQREVGYHTKSFANALRSALREDPDVILVGELRDLATISMAITAAETGHVVMATLHTNDCATTVDRLIDVFPPEQQRQVRVQLAASLKAVIAQSLIPRIDKKGLIAATEIMVGTTAISSLIREGKTHQIPSIIQTSAKDGMQTMDQGLKKLVIDKKIDKSEAVKRSLNKELIYK